MRDGADLTLEEIAVLAQEYRHARVASSLARAALYETLLDAYDAGTPPGWLMAAAELNSRQRLHQVLNTERALRYSRLDTEAETR